MSEDIIENAINVLISFFYSPINSLVNTDKNKSEKKESHHRYKSWEYCYEAFQEAHKTYVENEEKEINFDDFYLSEQELKNLSLHLGFYLASWGMYRGSSFLLQKDYKIHIEPIKILLKESWIWGDAQDSNSFKDFDNKKLTSLRNKIAEAYGLAARNSNNLDEPEDDPKGLTDTLFTKILLGICGNIPAYDRYCKKALIKLGWNSNLYSKESYTNIKNYADKLKLENWPNHNNAPYPKMKLMDMFLFEYGNFLECAENLEKESTATKKINYITRLKALLSFAELFNTNGISITELFIKDLFSNDSKYCKNHLKKFNKKDLTTFVEQLLMNCKTWLKDNPSVKVRKYFKKNQKEIELYYDGIMQEADSPIQKCQMLLEIIVQSKKSANARKQLLSDIDWEIKY